MELLNSLLELIATGTSGAIIALLLCAVGYLVWERQKMLTLIEQYKISLDENHRHYSDSIERILDRYHNGNIELVQALNEIKIVLATVNKTML